MKEPMEVYSIRVSAATKKEVERLAKKCGPEGEYPRTFAHLALKKGLELMAIEMDAVKRSKSKQ